MKLKNDLKLFQAHEIASHIKLTTVLHKVSFCKSKKKKKELPPHKSMLAWFSCTCFLKITIDTLKYGHEVVWH